MKMNSHCWLRTALQRSQWQYFYHLMKYSNKRRTTAAALIRGRRLLTFPPHVQRLIEGGAYSGVALIQVNTVSAHGRIHLYLLMCFNTFSLGNMK